MPNISSSTQLIQPKAIVLLFKWQLCGRSRSKGPVGSPYIATQTMAFHHMWCGVYINT